MVLSIGYNTLVRLLFRTDIVDHQCGLSSRRVSHVSDDAIGATRFFGKMCFKGYAAMTRNFWLARARTHLGKGLFDLVKIWTLVVKRKKNAKLIVIGIEPQGAREKLVSPWATV